MAQAIPITHQQKMVRTPTTVTSRWPSSSQQPSQDQQQQSSSEATESPSVYATTLFMHSTLPTTAASFDRNRVSSSTIPRQQKQTPAGISSSNALERTTSNFQTHSTAENCGHRRGSYESASVQQQKLNNIGNYRDPNAPVPDLPPGFIEDANKNTKTDQFQTLVASSPTVTPPGSSTTMVILHADRVVTTTAEEDGSATVTITGLGGAGTGRSSPTMSDSKWTSFDDSEGDADEASSRHHSESEHQNLLADIDATSDGGEDTTTLTGSVVIIDDEDASLAITPSLRTYYEECFEKLRQDILAHSYSNDVSKGHDSTDHCSSPPVAASSPAALGAVTNAQAVWGKHPRVKEFFERSNLDKSELGQIWALADVNMDGWLNVDEFCVAMHLVVRCVQAGLPVPPLLPAHLRPPMTPPISSPVVAPSSATISGYGSGGFWTHFGTSSVSDQQTKPIATTEQRHQPVDGPTTANNFTAATVVKSDPQNALSPTPALKEFTNLPPATAYPNVAQPKPRRLTPDFLQNQERQHQQQQPASLSRPTSSHHSSSVPPGGSKFSAAPLPAPRSRTSTNDSILSNQKAGSKSPSQIDAHSKSIVTSPQTGLPPATLPKGPPPKPPPRPTAAATGAGAGHRHSRSVSLDLSKKMTEMQQQFTTATINYQAGPVQDASAVDERVTTGHPPVTTDQTMVKKEMRDAQIQTSHDVVDESQRKKRDSTAPMLDLSMDIGEVTPRIVDRKTPPARQQSTELDGMDESRDWTKRCERLRRMNGDLERDLRKLSEVRIGLEMHLKRLEKL